MNILHVPQLSQPLSSNGEWKLSFRIDGVQLMMVNGGFLTLLEFCYSGLKLNLLTFLYIPVLYEQVHCLQLTQSVHQPLLDLLDQVNLSEEQQI